MFESLLVKFPSSQGTQGTVAQDEQLINVQQLGEAELAVDNTWRLDVVPRPDVVFCDCFGVLLSSICVDSPDGLFCHAREYG